MSMTKEEVARIVRDSIQGVVNADVRVADDLRLLEDLAVDSIRLAAVLVEVAERAAFDLLDLDPQQVMSASTVGALSACILAVVSRPSGFATL
jgi:acyl carrier protein